MCKCVCGQQVLNYLGVFAQGDVKCPPCHSPSALLETRICLNSFLNLFFFSLACAMSSHKYFNSVSL